MDFLNSTTAYYAAAVPISVLVALGLIRKWRASSWAVCNSNTCLRGKTFLITGANSGIGLATAKALVRRRGRVIFACRNMEKAKKAIAQIRQEHPEGGEMIPIHLDLASFESIEKFIEIVKAGFHKIDVLINNAGICMPLGMDAKTREGFEIHFGVNHLGHFYLTTQLIEHLKRAAPSRVIMISSTLHDRAEIDFNDLMLIQEIQKARNGNRTTRHNTGYNNSKLMNVYFARTLADKLKDYAVDVNACCPGFTYTNLFRYSLRWYHYVLMLPVVIMFMRTAEQSAQTVIFCATDSSIEGKTGKFYRDCAEYSSTYRFTKEEERKLWKVSEELVKARRPL